MCRKDERAKKSRALRMTVLWEFRRETSQNNVAGSARCGLRWLKNSERHRHDKHLRGGPFDSAPPNAVSRDKSVRRSAQDDGFVAMKRRLDQIEAPSFCS